jgi:glycosidase
MPNSIWAPEIQSTIAGARTAARAPYASPEDWRDTVMYFLLVDRFNNPAAPPRVMPYDTPVNAFQGGTFAGVQAAIPYLQQLGIGAVWLSPVLANCPFSADVYHGYGIHDFLSAEPRFATDPANADAELRALVDALHDAGLHVIFDIVLNHTGDVFAYAPNPSDALNTSTSGTEATFSPTPLPVMWRDASGRAQPAWPVLEQIASPQRGGVVWPSELQKNEYFRRQGTIPNWQSTAGDFMALKQILTTDPEMQDVLVRVYQHVVAKFDCDGFRIDTMKYLEPSFARTFCNAVREYCLSIGKKNFFIFGEVFDTSDARIATFVGRNAMDPDDPVGADAALDFPLVYSLPNTVKGMATPATVSNVFQTRKAAEEGILSSHGDASQYFVTFLDNHDLKKRFYYVNPSSPDAYDDQVPMGLACLLGLQGIPCVYYGTEQGLHGPLDPNAVPIALKDAAVREALWGKTPTAFDTTHPFYRALATLTALRANEPALRYGRQYFRPLSGDGHTFGVSPYAPGVIAFSRILNDREIVIVANADPNSDHALDVIVDASLNPLDATLQILYSNKATPTPPTPVARRSAQVTVYEVDGSITSGPVSVAHVNLQPMEVQVLAQSARSG